MRLIAILAQLAAVLVAVRVLGVKLPVAALLGILASLAAFNAWVWWRLRDARAVTENELFANLAVDVLALTLVLGLAGGAFNPFASLFLLLVALGAAFLSQARAWALALASVACYTALLFFSTPLEMPADEDEHALMAAAMWMSYLVTAAVIVSVLMRLAFALRHREQVLAEARRKASEDEHIIRIGALAAGAAHELGSPLCSIAVIVRDLQETHAGDAELASGLGIVSGQLAACRETLTTLLSYGNSTLSLPVDHVPFDAFLRECIDWFGERRPEARVHFEAQSAGPAPRVPANRALRQALTSLLDNAADVSPQAIRVTVSWDDEWLRIRVVDRGPGLPADVADSLGKLFFTTKQKGKGCGLGLYLANFVVVRFGGWLGLDNAEGGGAAVEIVLPVSNLASGEEPWRS